MTTRKRAVVRIVDCISVLLALDGLAFAVATMLLLVGLVFVLVALVRWSPVRWRILSAYCIGFALFGGAVVFVSQWIAARLPS